MHILDSLKLGGASGMSAEPEFKHWTAKRKAALIKERRYPLLSSGWHQSSGSNGMEISEARRLRDLEQENARLKRLLAEAELDKAALKELVEGKW